MTVAQKITQDTSSLSRDGWIDCALDRLAVDGIDKVLIAPLARELGVTKGSFYWHFKDRQDLLDAMLTRWEGVGTLDIIDQVEKAGGTADERLRRTIELSIEQVSVRLEPALRQWGRRDKKVRQALRRVDEHRLAFLRKLFVQLCDNEVEAEARAWLLYSLITGRHLIAAKPAQIKSKDLLKSCLAVLTGG
ncbi:MAG: TetR/AcrR family transcriptional regulator [Alphaproteobacteria bacterium]|jgi:AcrR family transcriptional regulator|nr:TetR/AcrR family transcriptional regulator [Alphaproteobacteria bacterium]MBT4019618.1 TetR/AcrR family transcriptional regulator [Alphaproteobacteria bacterium]MBT4967113.1 TetR/AcrR family transcriptional regulator [Alphaproteobacteria bacterium]MBT5160818.1 TetR/AcrR family transcriptional regulator [Alphaproteobacteria bacterium]MBT5917886.1 TetR/AcrR family transcriptional regulator [Alphaproteobacteria bacterium]